MKGLSFPVYMYNVPCHVYVNECALHTLSCRPFDPELYEDEGEEDEILDEEGRARLKLKVTIATHYSTIVNFRYCVVKCLPGRIFHQLPSN